MKEKLKAARVEIIFLVLTLAFLAAFFLAAPDGKSDDFPLFSVEVSGAEGEAEETLQRVNINTASREELEMLPGIGEKLAKEIILWRQENGPFMEKEDLLQVDGLSEKIYFGLADYVILQDNDR